MKGLIPVLALAALGAATSSLHAQSLFAIKEAPCLTNVSGLFTVGEQYVGPDGIHLNPNNGVLPDSWSMLVRWQGNTMVANPVSYNVGAFTGVSVPSPRTTWQRGFQPEDSQGTPAVQLHCDEAGMLINTWSTPHRNIEGGSYNDMYGYSWSAGNRPWAFRHVFSAFPVTYDIPSDLVLKARIKVPFLGIWSGTPRENPTTWTSQIGPDQGLYGLGQSVLFAYIADVSHPNLPPIALLGGMFASSLGACTKQAHVGWDYEKGVWFTGATMCSTDTTTYDAADGAPTAAAPFSDWRTFRIRFSRENLTNLVTRINNTPFWKVDACTRPGVDCPPIGYSTNPNDYVLNYAGVIDELSLLSNDGMGHFVGDEAPDRQASMSTGIQAFGAYWYHP